MADYRVTGVLNPDVGGTYTEAGICNGEAYYLGPLSRYLWFSPKNVKLGVPNFWAISVNLGDYQAYSTVEWRRDSLSIEGAYQPITGASGVATVFEYVGGGVVKSSNYLFELAFGFD